MFSLVHKLGEFLIPGKGWWGISAPDAQTIFDARSPHFLELVRRNADHLIEEYSGDLSILEKKEREPFEGDRRQWNGIGEHLTLKLALSKARLQTIQKKIRIGIVVPVFRETVRMRPRANHTISDGWTALTGQDPHPHGENFVCEKAKQVAWLTSGNQYIDIRIIYVDDACDCGSGELIRELLTVNKHTNSHVYDLRDIITHVADDTESLVSKSVADLSSPDDSQKSGSVYAGIALAIEEHECDIIVYTDADLSYDLGQLGNLIHPLIFEDAVAAVADRRDPRSYTEDTHSDVHEMDKKRMKAILGSLRAHLFSDILPSDTQAGFKAVWAHHVRPVVEMPKKDSTFAFDVQFLARLNQHTGKLPATVATVCIDSPEETTADGTRTYQLMAKTYLDVLNELGVSLTEQQKISYTILELLAGERHNMSDVVWKAFSHLMQDVDIVLEDRIHEARVRLKKYFSVPSNNTAVSLPLEDVHIGDLQLVMSHILRENPARQTM